MISTDLHKWMRDDHWDIVIKSYTYKCILCSLTGGLETLSVSLRTLGGRLLYL